MASATAAGRGRYGAPRATYGSVAYDLDFAGPAARPLAGGTEVLQPRPLVRPRERAVARPKVRVREAGKVSVFAVVGFAAVFVFAVLVLMSCIQITVLSDDIAALKSELSGLQDQEVHLRTQYELAFDKATIESKVTANGSMVKPQAGQILYLDLSESDSVVLFREEETPLKGVEGALAGIRRVFDNVVEYFK